jgi:hypothetical protein
VRLIRSASSATDQISNDATRAQTASSSTAGWKQEAYVCSAADAVRLLSYGPLRAIHTEIAATAAAAAQVIANSQEMRPALHQLTALLVLFDQHQISHTAILHPDALICHTRTLLTAMLHVPLS